MKYKKVVKKFVFANNGYIMRTYVCCQSNSNKASHVLSLE